MLPRVAPLLVSSPSVVWLSSPWRTQLLTTVSDHAPQRQSTCLLTLIPSVFFRSSVTVIWSVSLFTCFRRSIDTSSMPDQPRVLCDFTKHIMQTASWHFRQNTSIFFFLVQVTSCRNSCDLSQVLQNICVCLKERNPQPRQVKKLLMLANESSHQPRNHNQVWNMARLRQMELVNTRNMVTWQMTHKVCQHLHRAILS